MTLKEDEKITRLDQSSSFIGSFSFNIVGYSVRVDIMELWVELTLWCHTNTIDGIDIGVTLVCRKEFPMSDPLRFSVGCREITFEPVPLDFIQRRGITDVFAKYQEKTLGQTLQKKRYKSLIEKEDFKQSYFAEVDKPLGSFLRDLKLNGDGFYTEFLNPHGDKEYCEFSIQGDLAARKGLYCYTVDGEVRYIGRSRDPFKKRVNQGYGVIHPKNCYRDGQATNCHLNSLIAEETGAIEFWACPLECDNDIVEFERRLIKEGQPKWNTALKDEKSEVQDPSSWAGPVFWVGATLTVVGLILVAASFYRWERTA